MNESTLVPREEMSDLDWLARNVHVWKSGYDLAVVQRGGGEIYVTWPSACSCGITKKQWLSRRAELQNRPSWKDAPEWARNLAQHSVGRWTWYEEDPTPNDNGFWVDGGVCKCAGDEGEVLGDWRDTLEKRPETYLKSMSGVHSNCDMATLIDELNDIDESVFGDGFLHKNAATAKQPAPKGSGNPILGMVLADLTNRALEGKEKYGEPLLAHNGRNPLWDAYQEALDLAMYLRQAIEEQK